MKRIRICNSFWGLSIILFSMAALAGCKEKKQSEDIITSRVEVQKPTAPVRIQAYADSKEIQWLGRTYTVEWKRTPDDSLSMVKDEDGQKYVDNRAAIRIIRPDGSVFFHKSFTKSAFTAYLPEKYCRLGILEGLVFDEVDGNHLVFAASVSLPQTEDEYIPLEVKVDNFGNVTIQQDNSLDTYGSDEDDDDGV
ncbi:MAG: DUF4738 domain-containing protein [Prevotella sp.]|jgi:hypothetical protein|nr:DUF4738 domain-containing protein [Prevotella sp.]